MPLKIKSLLILTLCFAQCISAQEAVNKTPVQTTFNTSRLINFHTIETLPRRCLDFRIAHRFAELNTGMNNAWGLDGGANIRLALEYSHNGKLMLGLGRTSAKKIVDGFLKYKLLQQKEDNSTPLSITLFTSIYHTFEYSIVNNYNKYQLFYDRLSYCHEIMAAKKFSPKLSLQLTLAMVHFNLVDNIQEGNDCYISGMVAQFNISPKHALTLEYGYRLNKYSKNTYYDSFGIGYDWRTGGGHVFQMHFTNSFGLTENQYFMYTNSPWSKWAIRLGFNISRYFKFPEKTDK